MKIDINNIQLGKLHKLEAQLQKALLQMRHNIADENTDAEKTRKIVITLHFSPKDSHRGDHFYVNTEVKTQFPPSQSYAGEVRIASKNTATGFLFDLRLEKIEEEE